MSLRIALLLAIVLFSGRSASADPQAPTGFMVPPETDEEPADEPPPKEEKPAPKKKRKAPETETWNEPAPKRGIIVIEENTAVPSTIRVGEKDPDRTGRPLGSSDNAKQGVGLVPNVRGSDNSFTFKANAGKDDDDDSDDEWFEDKKPAKKPKKGAEPERVPTGYLLPQDAAEEEDSKPTKADDARAAMREERTRPDDNANAALGSGWSTPAPTTRNFLDNGSGSHIQVEETKTDYKPETFLEVGRKQREAAPPPPKTTRLLQSEPKKAVVAPRPREEPVVAEKPAPAVDSDPFAKMENDLRAIDGKPKAEPAAPSKPAEALRVAPPKLTSETFSPSMIEPSPTNSEHMRDLTKQGLSFGAGAGAVIAEDPRSGYTADLAYGVEATWNPAFAGDFALDLSFFRSARTDGTSFITVNSAWNNGAVRLLYTRAESHGLLLGFGGGLLLTFVQAEYVLNDNGTQAPTGSQLRPGLDGSLIAGWRSGMFEARVDLRALLRGGIRLDFLPTLSLGVSL